MPQPLVSIVTPSYNQAHFLEETIQSILSQDYPNLEYIIVDGGSTDGSLDMINRYASRLAWWVSEPDQGQTDAINKGFSHAHGDILAWLNSDDTYLPGAISEAVTFTLAHPQATMIYGDANLVDEHGKIIGRFPARQTDLPKLLRGSVHIPQQASFFRASFWKQVGLLDPDFQFAMDYDLWVRLAKLGPLLYTPRLWANFRLHGAGKSVIIDDRCYPEMMQVYQRERGGRISWLALRWYARRLFYAWLPLSWRVKIRQAFDYFDNLNSAKFNITIG
jgi:glycosyltransferase involved in cell wall biosynthesis